MAESFVFTEFIELLALVHKPTLGVLHQVLPIHHAEEQVEDRPARYIGAVFPNLAPSTMNIF